jgi:type I restriction enzyme, S subunit
VTTTRPLIDVLGKRALFCDGDWVESKDQDPSGDVRLTQLADVGDGEFVNKSARFMTSSRAKALQCTFLQPGDILIARMPDPLGRACIFPGDPRPCVTVVDVCIVRPDEHIDRRWLVYAINSPMFRRQISRHINGTTRQRISRSNLGTIGLDVPSLPEQRRIAAILDKADAVRRKRRDAIGLTEELQRAAFLEMFGDPRTNPKGWRVAQLGEMAEVVTDGEHQTPVRSESGYMLLSARNIKNGFIDLKEKVDHVPPEEFARIYRRCAPRREDVLISCSGTIGRVTVVRLDEPFAMVRSVAMVRLDPQHMLPSYLEALLQTAQLQRVMQSSANKSAQANLFLGQIKRLPVLVPTMRAQREFIRAQTAICAARSLAEQATASQDALFASLLHRAFRGEL